MCPWGVFCWLRVSSCFCVSVIMSLRYRSKRYIKIQYSRIQPGYLHLASRPKSSSTPSTMALASTWKLPRTCFDVKSKLVCSPWREKKSYSSIASFNARVTRSYASSRLVHSPTILSFRTIFSLSRWSSRVDTLRVSIISLQPCARSNTSLD